MFRKQTVKLTDGNFEITVFNAINNPIIPNCESTRIYWSGQTPATLGEVIKTMSLPPGATRNITGGTLPPNSTH